MRFVDLSQPVYDGSPNYPGHPPVRSEVIADHPRTGWRVELLTMTNHTGSHVDAPLHKIAGGASLDDIPLERWAGPAYLADFRGVAPATPIGDEMLKAKLPGDLADKIVLIATGWGQKRAKTDEWLRHSPFVDARGAKFLAARGVRGVGIDHYSIAGSDKAMNAEVHTILLDACVWIVEELRFPDEAFALPQPVQYLGLPVNLRGHSGGFCRPVLVV